MMWVKASHSAYLTMEGQPAFVLSASRMLAAAYCIMAFLTAASGKFSTQGPEAF